MADFKNRKFHEHEKPFPGCMGRMVNLFDLSPGIPGNRLLTDRAHRDGSHVRSQTDVSKKMLGPVRDWMEDKPLEYELKRSPSYKKSNGTPVKMLIAQEMSKEVESKQKPPTVVARLMGLDGLPGLQPVSTVQESYPEGYFQNASTKLESMPRNLHEDKGFLDKQVHYDIHPSNSYNQEKTDYKDVYEVWQQSSKINRTKDQLGQKGRCEESTNEKKMALVRQKFIEAKRLATDEKLRQSREFQEALEVLSSNRDLFLKFLQEPNSLFSKNLYELHSASSPQMKHITVLKPSKMMETDQLSGPELKPEKESKKHHDVEGNRWDRYKPNWDSTFDNQRADNTSQPTRIVVLKPSLGKTHDIKAVVSSPISSPRLIHNRDICGDYEGDSARGSREIAKEITRQMRESLSSGRRDEVLTSSMLLNGYVGDESSFNQSDNDYVEDGNFSDIDTMTPTSRRSWDNMNRYNSPYSSSSFSRASYSPESSVTREAKKRLSERLALMSSTGSSQEQRRVRRSSSTLGEMLTLSNIKKPVISVVGGNDGECCQSSSSRLSGGDEVRRSIACFSGSVDDSPRNLSRSRSVPVSSTAYQARLNVQVPEPRVSDSVVPKELAKPKDGKSSFKGKVSSLFFSRSKKLSKEKHNPSSSIHSCDEHKSSIAEVPEISCTVNQFSVGKRSDNIAHVMNDTLEEEHPYKPGGLSCEMSSPSYIWKVPKPGSFPSEVASSAKIRVSEGSSENQDQPSPVSVLEAPFEEDVNVHSRIAKTGVQELSGHLHLRGTESTAESPLDAVSQSLSWEDCSLESAASHPLEPYALSTKAEEEKERFLFIQALLLAAGFDNEKSETVYAKGYAPVNPLDPLLLEKCINVKDDWQHQNEAKRRQWRSERRLLFDCVNASLVEMVGSTLSRSCSKRVSPSPTGEPVIDVVWNQVSEWWSTRKDLSCGESDARLQVERVVRNEVVAGRGWGEQMGLESDRIGEEIERELLKQLLEDAFLALL